MRLYKNIILLLTSVLSISSCVAPGLDSYEPPFMLEASNAIVDETSADLALYGLYSQFTKRDMEGTPYMYLLPEIMGVYAEPSSYDYVYRKDPQYVGLVENSPVASGTNFFINGIYPGMYKAVNMANWIVSQVEKLKDDSFSSPERRQEVIAEAKTMRAMAYFYLLRLFGEFYNMESEYGLDIRLTPVSNADAFPRKSVKETYDAILADLDFGIEKGPALKVRYYVNKVFAKGLKARVLLYMGDYAGAAKAAKDVIENHASEVSLSETKAIYLPHDTRKIYDNTEVLFGTAAGDDDQKSMVGLGLIVGSFIDGISSKFQTLLKDSITIGGQKVNYGGEARSSLLYESTFGPFFNTYKYNEAFGADIYEMAYHMRISELYLILAEASARVSKSATAEALGALNALRTARGATSTGGDGFETYPNGLTYDQFLELVRIEKAIELNFELGESWFDMVRYDYADGFGTGFKVSDLKATAVNPQKFILPIPQTSIDAAGGVVKQNPGYN